MDHLFEVFLSYTFLKFFVLVDQFEQIATASVLHHEQEVLLRFEYFEKSDDVAVLDFTQNVDFLHHFLPR